MLLDICKLHDKHAHGHFSPDRFGLPCLSLDDDTVLGTHGQWQASSLLRVASEGFKCEHAWCQQRVDVIGRNVDLNLL